MASEKSYSNEQAILAMQPGPQTQFNPLNTGWSVLAPYTGAWATFDPIRNRVIIDASMASNGAHASDGYQIATMPATDANGNSLLPQQVVVVDCTTDVLQTGTTPRSPALHIQASGVILIYGVAAASTRLDCCGSYSLNQL